MDDEATVEFSEGDAGPPADTSAPADGSSDGPAAATPPGRSRLAVAMLAVSALLVIVAVGFGVLGAQAQSEAADAHDQATAATERRHELASKEQSLDATRTTLEEEMMALPDKYEDVGASFDGLATAHGHFIDLLNDAIDHYNAGDDAGAVAIIQGEASTAVTDVTTKKTQVQQTVQSAEDALHQLEEAL
jgi:hypothetical protein